MSFILGAWAAVSVLVFGMLWAAGKASKKRTIAGDEDVDQLEVGSVRQRCLSRIAQAGDEGYTADALECDLGAPHQTVTARLRELQTEGLIVDSGKRRTTRRNRQAIVYVARVAEAAE